MTSAWVGYDLNPHPLGKYETGGRAALPIWLAYMTRALEGREQPEFAQDQGGEHEVDQGLEDARPAEQGERQRDAGPDVVERDDDGAEDKVQDRDGGK